MSAGVSDGGSAGRPGVAGPDGHAQEAGRDYEQLAEALIDEWTGRLRAVAVRVAARAREEAEDLVAEARERRRSFGGS
jgi:hypothetical protein